ncbi:unnamed protein product [Victoria cruziana]
MGIPLSHALPSPLRASLLVFLPLSNPYLHAAVPPSLFCLGLRDDPPVALKRSEAKAGTWRLASTKRIEEFLLQPLASILKLKAHQLPLMKFPCRSGANPTCFGATED